MLEEALVQGFDDVSGVEPSQEAATLAHESIRSRILRGLFSHALIGDRRFDAITCFQTLDHVPDPVTFVHDCYRALKPGGTVLFINHNIASWTARLLGERCPMIDVEHIFLHTPATMRILFERAGFQNIHVFTVTNLYPLRYWLHILPVPRFFNRLLQKFARLLRIDAFVVPLSVGNLGLIAQKIVEEPQKDAPPRAPS